ncbi:MAG: uracil-DNA glycosylase, partial [Massilia sp.]|nr:uracil-DNA glycosylase [Massilia sp.]
HASSPAAAEARAPAASPAAANPGFVPPPPRDPAWGEIPRTSAPAPIPWAPPAPVPLEEPEPADSLEAIAGMDWDELHAAIARCERCGSCAGRKPGSKPVYGAGSRQARWFVAAGAATAADEKAGQPLAGDPGKLFDNMLAAVGLSREQDVWVTQLVKCRPASANGGDRAPTSEEAAACRPFLERELALTGATTVLTLGQIAANGLLGKPLQEPLAGSRGAVHAWREASLVATLHPGELLRRGLDKALAWADLCRARGASPQRDALRGERAQGGQADARRGR